jgi:hypothetical protein
MKSGHFHATTLKTFFSKTCFVSFLLIASFTGARAQKVTGSPAVASVSYLGYNNDLMSFLLKYENKTGEKYTVTITDSDGNILYNEIFADKNFSKIFKTRVETGRLTFTISSPKNREEKKFQVSTERRLVEEFSITKLN